MEKEYFDDLIESITIELKDCYVKKKKDNNDLNKGILIGMYCIADCIQNRLDIQNEINNTNKYENFINLVNKIEKNLD